MALFTELPLYKAAYDLLMDIYQRTTHFPREHKYSLGERLKIEITEVLINIYKANSFKAEDRLEAIQAARLNIEVVRMLVRLSRDLKIIGLKGFVATNIKIEEVSRQLSSWRKYTARAHHGKNSQL